MKKKSSTPATVSIKVTAAIKKHFRPIDFQLFIDYKTLGRDYIKEACPEVIEDHPDVLKLLAELWKDCKIEKVVKQDGMTLQAFGLRAPKYPHQTVYTQDIGDPTLYVISSKYSDLISITGYPEFM